MENNSKMLLTAWEKCASALMSAMREAKANGDVYLAEALEDVYFNLSEDLLSGISEDELSAYLAN